MAVTPVRTLSPRMRVVCPTLTPATSVMAFSGPGGNTPICTPRSRTRGRPSVWANATELVAYNKVIMKKDLMLIKNYPVPLCDPCGKDFSSPTPYFTSRYLLANTAHTTPITTKQSKLPSGPTIPPESHAGPCNDDFSRCPGNIVPLSGTE